MNTLSIEIKTDKKEILAFLDNPFNLRLWTVHRDLYWIDNACQECIMQGKEAHFATIQSTIQTVQPALYKVQFSWLQDGQITKSFSFQLAILSHTQVCLSLQLPLIQDEERKNTLVRLIQIEFGLLKQLLEKSTTALPLSDAIFLQNYHNNLSFQ